MLEIKTPDRELYNEKNNTFETIEGTIVHLEHSLYSISKWEAHTKKPFLTDIVKSPEETLEYIYDMCVDDVDRSVFGYLDEDFMAKVNEYISDSMTATTFTDYKKSNSVNHEIMTTEVLYYLMFTYQIPKECEHWNLSRLLTLLRVFDVKNNQSQKKLTMRERLQQNRELNAKRLREQHTKG